MNDKALLVTVGDGREAGSYLITHAERVNFMDTPCIKGVETSTTAKPNWLTRQTIYIPLQKVLLIVEYDSADAYRDVLRRYREAQIE